MAERKSPAKSPAKRGAEESPSHPAKRQRSSSTGHKLNVNDALDRAHEAKPFHEVIKLPPSALQGLTPAHDAILAKLKVHTIQELGEWKYYHLAKAIATLAHTELADKRAPTSAMNINKALDRKWEEHSLKEIVEAPISAFEGLAHWVDEHVSPLHIKSIQGLADWRFAHWAEALCTLAKYEATDFSH
eukprot:TRINITY_DN80164_c0_g1_i1.p1 TRINITY_DN80164_c0_g1~~TRINITY_DN80164_c0_g1_i1.p1  ORF type:complete len:197 (+),score=44.51 TRINITY_DN80164_c0_g1_i1:30-593(+)